MSRPSMSTCRVFEKLRRGAAKSGGSDGADYNYVKSFVTLIQWPRCLLRFQCSEDTGHRILPILRALSPKEIELQQQYCQHVFRNALQDDSTLMRSVMLSFRERFMGILPNLPLIDGDLNPFIA